MDYPESSRRLDSVKIDRLKYFSEDQRSLVKEIDKVDNTWIGNTIALIPYSWFKELRTNGKVLLMSSPKLFIAISVDSQAQDIILS